MPPSTLRMESSTMKNVWNADVWKVDDDWTAVTSKEEKKRRQNRVNQRAYRRRNAPSEATKKKPFLVERFRITEVPLPSVVAGSEPVQNVTAEPSQPVVLSRDGSKKIPTTRSDVDDGCTQYMDSAESQALNALTDDWTHPLLYSRLESASRTTAYELLPNPDFLPGQTPKSDTTDVDIQPPPTDLDASRLVRTDKLGTMAPAVYTATSVLQEWIQELSRPPAPNGKLETGHFHTRDPHGHALFRISFESLISPISPENRILHQRNPSHNDFPLSSDHLLRLIHFNVFRALITNKAVLRGRTLQKRVGLDFILPEDKNLCDGLALIRSKPGQVLPTSLYPTYIQASIAHSSWINMFPFASIRDNLIRAEKDFDHHDLCYDLFGEMFFSAAAAPNTSEVDNFINESEDDLTAKRKGFIVWGEPWDTGSWEVTPGFVKKWAWLLRNGQDLIESTNRWRAMRDESPLAYPFAEEVY